MEKERFQDPLLTVPEYTGDKTLFREGGEEAGSAAISDVALANREKLTEKEKQAGSSGVAEPSNRCHREESPNPRPVYLTSSRDGREQRATGSARTTRSGQVFLQTSGFPSFPLPKHTLQAEDVPLTADRHAGRMPSAASTPGS